MENRIKDLEKAIKEYRIDRLATMRGHMAEYVSALNPTFCKALNTVMKEQLQRQSEEIESKVKYLYLCRLHTRGCAESGFGTDRKKEICICTV